MDSSVPLTPTVHEDVRARCSGSRSQVLPGRGSGNQGPQLQLCPEARSQTELWDPQLSNRADRYVNKQQLMQYFSTWSQTHHRRVPVDQLWPLNHGIPFFSVFTSSSSSSLCSNRRLLSWQTNCKLCPGAEGETVFSLVLQEGLLPVMQGSKTLMTVL